MKMELAENPFHTEVDFRIHERVGEIKFMKIMKTKKLNLNDLKVKSFITNLDQYQEAQAKGGGRRPYTIEDCETGAAKNTVCSCDIV